MPEGAGMGRRGIAAVLVVLIAAGLAGCTLVGVEDVNLNNSVPVFQKNKRVLNGIIYTKTEYTDGSFDYSAHNEPPKGYTGHWASHPDYRGTTIYVGPKGTHRTIEKKGNPPPDPLDPAIWEEPQVIVAPAAQPVSAPLAGPTSLTARSRGEGGGGGGGGGGGH
jgi:hypothetical protein